MKRQPVHNFIFPQILSHKILLKLRQRGIITTLRGFPSRLERRAVKSSKPASAKKERIVSWKGFAALRSDAFHTIAEKTVYFLLTSVQHAITSLIDVLVGRLGIINLRTLIMVLYQDTFILIYFRKIYGLIAIIVILQDV